MQRELLILRHGKSDWNTADDDFHRPLKNRGKRGAQRIAAWLQTAGLLPDHVISSPATRAIETARKACKAMGLTAGDIHPDQRLYGADTRQILEVLADCPESARRVLLVAHNPGLEDLLEWLVNVRLEIPADGKLLPTATLARLEIARPWDQLRPGSGSLLEIVRPKGLPKDFPYPGDKPTQRRDRPAYYYTQSSVVPYRIEQGRLEVLIVASSSGRHWVMPKGIKEPGMTPRDSAAKEAWEEGGVEGVVEGPGLGSYRYPKWGAECEVEVFALRVTRVIPRTEWEESHRGRRWVSVAEAAEQVHQKALVPMLAALSKRVF